MDSRTPVLGPDRFRFAAAALVALFVLVAPYHVALAQGLDTGAVEIVVRAPDGTRVSGGEVFLEGPQRARVARSSEDGIVRFLGLIPGSYRALVTVGGFAPHRTAKLRVVTGETRAAFVDLEPAQVAETVLVLGARPVIDPTTVSVGAIVDDELVERTPSGGGLWNSALDKVPSLVLSGVDVGGGNATQQQTFSAHGSFDGQNQLNLNGTQTSDFRSGAASMFYPVNAFSEIQVSTVAHDIEYQSPGVVVNMVSKSGSNQVHGGVRFVYSNEDLAGENVSQELLDQGLETGVPNTLLSDLDLQLGGPLVPDRLWGFVDYWRFDEERLILGVPEDERDERSLRNMTVNLDWQPADRQRLSFRYFFSDKFRVNVGASPALSPATSTLQTPSDTHIVQANWLATWDDDVYSDLRVAFRGTVFGQIGRRPDSSAPHPDYAAGIPNGFDFGTGVWSGAPGESRNWLRSWEASGHGARYLRRGAIAHDLKAGFQLFDARDWGIDLYPGGAFQWFFLGQSAYVDLVTNPAGTLDSLGREAGEATALRSHSLYLQDSMDLGSRWHLNVGVRWDRSAVRVPAQARPDSRWAGVIPDDQGGANFRAATFEAIDDVVTWSDLVPRLSVAFDPTGGGNTSVEASYGQYSLNQLSSAVGPVNANGTGYNEYVWTDANGDGAFQWGEQGALVRSFFPASRTEIDPDLRSPRSHELTLGVEHRAWDDLVVGLTGIYRTVSNPVGRINVGVPYGPIAERLGVESAYTPVVVTDPGPDGILGTTDDGGPITAWSQDPATFGQAAFLVTNPEEWGLDVPYDYRGVELVARKRFSDRWRLLASWSIGRTNSSVGRFFDNPNADINRNGRTSGDRTHVVKANASYLWPDPVDIGFGVSLRHETGLPVDRRFVTPRVLAQGRATVFAAARGAEDVEGSLNGRLEPITLLDLRAEKGFDLSGGRGRLLVVFEAFNILNEAAPRAVVNQSGPNYGRIQQIVPPRVFRLGAGWVF